jgi:phage repressor protein C with HTH and peptisase S24 domain
MDGIGYKLKKIRKTLELSQIDMAKALDTTERTLRDYEKERFNVSYEFITKLVNVYKVNPNWLFRNEFPIFLDEETEGLVKNISPEEKSNLVFIPKYNPKAAAGGGTLVPAEYIEYFTAFDESWFRAFVNALPKHVTAITAEGDSMKPIINNGDLLLVDNSKTTPQDGIYVLNINDSLVVKRTQLLPNYKMRIISENPAYQPYEVDLKEDNVFIVGKVVWQGREMG